MTDKAALIQKIDQLEGLNSDEKAQLKELLNNQKKYGLVWEDKPEKVESQLLDQLPVLREVEERRIKAILQNPDTQIPPKGIKTKNKTISLDFGTTAQRIEVVDSNSSEVLEGAAPHHILIEGDNLHALTALSFTHKDKIDVIYIDPPYNTGKEDEFRYNDKWVLKDNPFRHTLWLNFMKKRLSLAKSLLNSNGVMILHIDEHEFDALNLLLETEIFDESSSLGTVVWNKQNPKGDVDGVASMHEYVLIYAKNKESFKALDNILTRAKPNALTILAKAKALFSKIGKKQIPDTVKDVIKPFNYSADLLKDFEVVYDLALVNTEFQAWISVQNFSGGEKAYKFIDKDGDVFQSVSMAAPDKPETRSHRPLVHPYTLKPCPVPAKGWRNPDDTMDKLLKDDLIIFGVDETTQPRKKYLLKENLSEVTPSIYNNGSSDEVLMKDLNLNFPYPKVTSAAQYFIKNIHPNPKLILDFFAGSGTTLHATMQLNSEDGGKRQCILVTNNENNIAEEVCYERNKMIIKGYQKAKGKEVPGLTNNNLHYFKADFVPMKPHVDADSKAYVGAMEIRKRITEESLGMLCIKENCFDEVSSGYPYIKHFESETAHLVLITNDMELESAIDYINGLALPKGLVANNQGEYIKVYVFSPNSYAYESDFAEIGHKVKLCALPEAILNAYRHVRNDLELETRDLSIQEEPQPTTLSNIETEDTD